MRITHRGARALAVLVAIPLLFAVAACSPEDAAICQATPGCVEAVAAAHREPGPSLHPFLLCVRHHESDRGDYPYDDGYRAANSGSSARGAYQFLAGTWRNASAAAGYPGYPSADVAPMAVQDAVALHTLNTVGRSPWKGTGC